MANTKTLITPYTCQIIYLEINRFVEKEITPHELILRLDLINIQNFSGIKDEDISRSKVVSTTLMEALNLDKFLRECPQEMQNYLRKDLSGIGVTDKILASNGELKMSEIINQGGFSDSPILMYMFLTLTGRFKERENLDRDRIKKEIIDKNKDTKLVVVEDALSKINQDLVEIDKVLNEQQQIDTQVNLDLINSTIKSIKVNLENKNNNVRVKGLEGLKTIEEELHELSKKTREQEELSVDVTEEVNKTIGKAQDVINYMSNSLSKSLTLSEQLKSKQDKTVQEFKHNEGLIDNRLNQLNNNFKNIEKTLYDLDLTPIIENITELVKSQELLKTNTGTQAELLGEVSSRITGIQVTIDSVKDVVHTLNKLIRSDMILGLSKEGNDMTAILRDVENIGGKYIEWKGESRRG